MAPRQQVILVRWPPPLVAQRVGTAVARKLGVKAEAMLKALRPRLELQTKKVSSSPPGLAPILRDPEISETGGKAIGSVRSFHPYLASGRFAVAGASAMKAGRPHRSWRAARLPAGSCPLWPQVRRSGSGRPRPARSRDRYGGVLVGAHPTQNGTGHLLGEWQGPVVRASRKAVCAVEGASGTPVGASGWPRVVRAVLFTKWRAR